MKILYITGAFPAPSETFVLNQIQSVCREGVDAQVLAYEKKDRSVATIPVLAHLYDEAVEAPRAAEGRLGRLFSTAKLAATGSITFREWVRLFPRALADRHSCYHTYFSLIAGIRRCGPFDLVHAQFGQAGRLAGELKRAGVFRAPLVVSFRGGDTTINLKRSPHVYARLYETADRFLAVSAHLREMHVDAGCDPAKIEVHHSGLNLSSWPYAPAASPGSKRVVCIGRLVEKKGVRYAVEAMTILRKEEPQAVLDIVGDGPLRATLEGQVRELGLEEAVQFHGWLNHEKIENILRKADVLIAGSITGADGDAEGIPNVAKEAMAAGVPVVATRHAGIPELVRHEETGLLVSERDSSAMAGAVLRLWREPERQSPMLERGRRLIEEEYDQDKLALRLVAIYGELAGRAQSERIGRLS
jgi:colanic acid/amylovoran biosynthesis glycosyltransferase